MSVLQCMGSGGQHALPVHLHMHVSGLAYSFRPRSLTSLVTAHAIAV